MPKPVKGDVIKFQQNGQEYEHTGIVTHAGIGFFTVKQLPLDPLGEQIDVMLSKDWWKILERRGKPYNPPVTGGPICSAVPILEDQCPDMNAANRGRSEHYKTVKQRSGYMMKKKGRARQ